MHGIRSGMMLGCGAGRRRRLRGMIPGRTKMDLSPLGFSTGAPTLGTPTLGQEAASGPEVWIEYDSTYAGSPTRVLGTGPFTDISASFWMKAANVSTINREILYAGAFECNIYISIEGDGKLRYYEDRDNGVGLWYHAWTAPLKTDGEWHHYGIKAGNIYIDGEAVSVTDEGTGEEEGSEHPYAQGTSRLFLMLSGGEPTSSFEIADLRLWKMASDVQAQSGYNSTLLNDDAGQIVGAWLMNDGAGNPADRSVQETAITLATGMTWKP